MSKLLAGTTGAISIAAVILIASLALNIIILNKVNDGFGANTTPAPKATTAIPPPPKPEPCPTYDVSKAKGWKDAATQLLRGLDISADPCNDFYQFACGRYLRETELAPDQSRTGTYDETQTMVNLAIADALDKLPDTAGTTEQLEKTAFLSCISDGQQPADDLSKLKELISDLEKVLGFPLFKIVCVTCKPTVEYLFEAMGRMERQFTGGPLLTSMVTSDYGDKTANALYISQPALSYPRDYYVLPQFIGELQNYAAELTSKLKYFSRLTGLPAKCADATLTSDACIELTAQQFVDTERKIAMASWPETEMRNYKQQYNPFTQEELTQRLPSIHIDAYVRELIRGIDGTTFKTVLTQPSYFAWLNGVFARGDLNVVDVTNYLAIQFILAATDEYGLHYPDTKVRVEPRAPYIVRRGFGTRRHSPPHRPRPSYAAATTSNGDVSNELRDSCVNVVMNYMPYGPGYTYVKLRSDRDKVRADIKAQTEMIIQAFSEQIDSLKWMTDPTKSAAHNKSSLLIRNYVWPTKLFGDFHSTKELDAYHEDYKPVADAKTYWETLKALKRAMETREFFRLLAEPADRENFLQSPAVVNAWYQPERNSITFPFGILNRPYYNLDYPQAYNFAGQGGSGGHELTHAYDDEGVQFGPEGNLVDCRFTHCGIMDDKSRGGFTDMAQCVVQQFNSKCCPLKHGNVHCVNGATTQGENIADLGGQLAAYRAYQRWSMANGPEQLLPGLEQFTPNQVFWLTYGFSWCMKITDARLTKQLLTDPHSPSSCRVNQVMQGIPAFGKDFNCKRGFDELFPKKEDNCNVWTGYN